MSAFLFHSCAGRSLESHQPRFPMPRPTLSANGKLTARIFAWSNCGGLNSLFIFFQPGDTSHSRGKPWGVHNAQSRLWLGSFSRHSTGTGLDPFPAQQEEQNSDLGLKGKEASLVVPPTSNMEKGPADGKKKNSKQLDKVNWRLPEAVASNLTPCRPLRATLGARRTRFPPLWIPLELRGAAGIQQP